MRNEDGSRAPLDQGTKEGLLASAAFTWVSGLYRRERKATALRYARQCRMAIHIYSRKDTNMRKSKLLNLAVSKVRE